MREAERTFRLETETEDSLTILIRMMEEKDLHEAAVIEQEVFSLRWTEEMFRESLENENYLFLAAFVPDGQLAGYSGLLRSYEVGDITNVAVAPRFRRQGIGRMLLSSLLKMGEDRGMTDFSLDVRKSNVPAISLYESLGFSTEGVRRGYYACPREDALIMWRHESLGLMR